VSFIIRAHEAHAHGVSLSKAAKVFTVFSTSKDHGQGKKAMAGCILVDTDKIQVRLPCVCCCARTLPRILTVPSFFVDST
jgi:hypothetical protein